MHERYGTQWWPLHFWEGGRETRHPHSPYSNPQGKSGEDAPPPPTLDQAPHRSCCSRTLLPNLSCFFGLKPNSVLRAIIFLDTASRHVQPPQYPSLQTLRSQRAKASVKHVFVSFLGPSTSISGTTTHVFGRAAFSGYKHEFLVSRLHNPPRASRLPL